MATSKTDIERYLELAVLLQVPSQDIIKFCREQADIERIDRKEEREAQELMQKEKEERETSYGEREREAVQIGRNKNSAGK